MNNDLESKIIAKCDNIYKQLGSAHNECVYQKALVIELYNMNAKSVEYEKAVPVFFTDSNGFEHTLGSERIDILARIDEHIVLLELKATTSPIRENVEIEQRHKDDRALKKMNIVCDVKMVVNFVQQKDVVVNNVSFTII